ncbi:MAG TPA: hypothetical protein VFS39_15795, partial [Nitrospira sp.]|nr:hypothetical protein [Nitrospira sp.]
RTRGFPSGSFTPDPLQGGMDYDLRSHRIWLPPQPTHTADKKGIAVALAFLVGIFWFAGYRSSQTQDVVPAEKPETSARAELRSTNQDIVEKRPNQRTPLPRAGH